MSDIVKNIIPQMVLPHSNGYSQLNSIIPEPKNNLTRNLTSFFSKSLSAIGNVASSVVDINPEYRMLLEKQMQVQQEMQQISMESNIEKSRHEIVMTPIRNIRVS